jgi:hypothetical protein
MTTLCLLHRTNEKCGLKKYQSSVKILKNNKTLSNEEFISEVQGNFPNIWV